MIKQREIQEDVVSMLDQIAVLLAQVREQVVPADEDDEDDEDDE